MDDRAIACTNSHLAEEVKERWQIMFKLKYLGKPKYFIGLEIAKSEKKIFLCQKKYTLDLLNDHGMFGVKLMSILWTTIVSCQRLKMKGRW